MAEKTYTYEEIESLKNADKAFRTSVSNVVEVVRLLVYFMVLPISLMEFSVITRFAGVFGIDEISSKAELEYLLGFDPEGPLRFLMFDYANGMVAFLIRGILVLAVIPWLAGVVTALIAAPVFRHSKMRLDLKLLKHGCHWALVGVLSVVASLLNLFRLAGLEQMNLMSGVRFVASEFFASEDGGILGALVCVAAMLLCVAFFAIPSFFFWVITQSWELPIPFSASRSSKNLPKEPIEAYIDRAYGPSPHGVKRICEQLFKDARLTGHSSQYTAIRYCMKAMRNNEECLRLSDNERWSLLYKIKSQVDIIVSGLDFGDPLKDQFKELYRDLDCWMDSIHHIPVFASDVIERMREPDGDHTERDARDDDVDAILKAMKRSEKFGSDWTGYDPEAPGPDPEAPVDSKDIW